MFFINFPCENNRPRKAWPNPNQIEFHSLEQSNVVYFTSSARGGDTMNEQDLKDQIKFEVSRLRELALRSTDPLVVAKALAVSEDNVQQLMLQRLTKTQQLAEVIAFEGNSTDEVQVFFRFIPANQVVHIVDTGFLVLVDLNKKGIVGITDPYDLMPEDRPRPFAVISSAIPWEYRTPEAAQQETEDQVRAYFRRLSITQRPGGVRAGFGGGGGGVLTVVDTIFGTETWSNGKSDDTKSDRTQDYMDQ